MDISGHLALLRDLHLLVAAVHRQQAAELAKRIDRILDAQIDHLILP